MTKGSGAWRGRVLWLVLGMGMALGLAGCASAPRPLVARTPNGSGLLLARGWEVGVALPDGMRDATAEFLEGQARARERHAARGQLPDPAYLPVLAYEDDDDMLSCWVGLWQPPGFVQRPPTAELTGHVSAGLMDRVLHTRREDLLREGLEAPALDRPLPSQARLLASDALQIGPLGGWRQRFRFEWPAQPGPVQPALHGLTLVLSIAPEGLPADQQALWPERMGAWLLAQCLAGGSEIWAKTKLDEGEAVLRSLSARPASSP